MTGWLDLGRKRTRVVFSLVGLSFLSVGLPSQTPTPGIMAAINDAQRTTLPRTHPPTARQANDADRATPAPQPALRLELQNEFAQQQTTDAPASTPARAAAPQLVASGNVLVGRQIDVPRDIHYRGDSKGLLTAIAASYGLSVLFDDNFPSRYVRFDLDNANFATAMQLASAVTKSFAVALGDTVLLAVVDNPENHRLFDRIQVGSFNISGVDSGQDLGESDYVAESAVRPQVRQPQCHVQNDHAAWNKNGAEKPPPSFSDK